MTIESYRSQDSKIIRTIRIGDAEYRSEIDNIADAGEIGPEAWWQAFLRGGKSRPIRSEKRTIRLLDAFCGCGGLSLGVSEAAKAFGFQPSHNVAIDLDEAGLEVYSTNFSPTLPLLYDVGATVDFQVLGQGAEARLAYEPEVVHPDLVHQVGKIDLFLAGPPCQGHSNLNNKTRRDDPRNLLYLKSVALAIALRARAVLIENVPEVRNDKSGVVQAAKAVLVSAGYAHIDEGVLATDDLGGAQTRKRFFLLAIREPGNCPIPSLAEVAASLRRSAGTLSWAIGDLLSTKANGIMNSVPALSEDNVRRIDYLFENDEYDLPDHVRPDCHKNGTTYRSVYGRLRWDQPSQTITTGFMTPGRGRYIHPLERRVLTPHEAARIQSFPDWFKWRTDPDVEPSRNSLAKWIGDAVPPVLGYAAAIPLIAGLRD